MDKEKKKELAEMDSRWDFEKTIRVPRRGDEHKPVDWENVKKYFNKLQESQGDLYMTVSKFELPTGLDNLRVWWRTRQQTGMDEVTFHHEQVYNFYKKLAYRLNISVGEAVYKVFYEVESLRDELGLGETVNVNISSAGDVAPAESKVDKDELQELIEDD